MSKTMSEKSIIFDGAMVRAILDGRKTQARQVAKFVVKNDGFVNSTITNDKSESFAIDDADVPKLAKQFSPIQVGDVLCVRETFAVENGDSCGCSEATCECPQAGYVYYRTIDCLLDIRWKPSVQMPQGFAHILLEVTDVRIERLNDISESDAMAEGGVCETFEVQMGEGYGDCVGFSHDEEYFESPIKSFAAFWDSINATRGFGWESNPWVVVYTFKKIAKPDKEAT